MTGLSLAVDCEGAHGFRLEIGCTLPASGVTAVYGPSGSGKTTLLECIAGLREPLPSSLIRIGKELWYEQGRSVPAWKRNVGYVFNDARLFPHMNVKRNLLYAHKRSRGANQFPIEDVVRWLEIQDLLPRAPDTLSAGQKQRVAMARALMSGPRLLLLDEPFANLDAAARRQCLRYLQRLSREVDLPMLYVSHDMEEVSELADYLLLLNDGRVTNEGPLIDLCSRLDCGLSEDERAAAILNATVKRHDAKYGLSELFVEGQTMFVTTLSSPTGNSHRVRIPARDISICRQRPTESSILNILPVTISEMNNADESRLTLRLALGSQYLLARITRKSADTLNLRVGDAVFAQIKSAALVTAPQEKT